MAGSFLYYGKILLRLLPEHDYAVRLEALAEALPLEVAATDAQGRVIVWNSAMARRSGVPTETALGQPLFDHLPLLRDDPNHDWPRLLVEALAGGAPRTFPRVPSGARLVRATIGPMRGSEGEVLGAALSLQDITRGVQEEERRRLRERTDAVAALGAGIAHELRNPLNALSLNLQLLQERIEDPDASRELLTRKTQAMVAEMKRVDELVQHLLEVSRGGAPVCRPERIDDVVAEIVSRLEGTAELADTKIHIHAGSSRMLPLERARIDRAIHNILRNAIEAAGSPGNVWVGTRDEPHTTVVVIEDDGGGIDPADRGRVFELFWTRKRGGTGLGLPLARRAVESHGGQLEVMERPGGGARFVIYLPTEAGHEVRREEGGEAWRAS